MSRLEQNHRATQLIISRIERNIELSHLCRVGQLIRTSALTKRQAQSLINSTKKVSRRA